MLLDGRKIARTFSTFVSMHSATFFYIQFIDREFILGPEGVWSKAYKSCPKGYRDIIDPLICQIASKRLGLVYSENDNNLRNSILLGGDLIVWCNLCKRPPHAYGACGRTAAALQTWTTRVDGIFGGKSQVLCQHESGSLQLIIGMYFHP